MTTNWKGGNGQWQTAANWSNGAPTTPQSFAVINAAGTYTVTIGSGLEYNVGAVRLAAANATLSIAGILDLKNKLTVSKGTLAVSGTVKGGSIAAAGGKIAFQNGTLDGVKYLGTLDLSTAANTVTIKDGLTLRNAAGTGPGAMTLGGTSQIDFAGSQTVNGGKWTITGGTVAQTGTLTLGASEDVEYKAAKSAFATSASLVNRGTFNMGKGSFLPANQLVNSGKWTVNGGGYFDGGSVTNTSTGTIAVYSGSTFVAQGNGTSAPDFDNAGTLTANDATLNLYSTNGDSFGTLDVTDSAVTLGGMTSVSQLNTLTNMLAGRGNQLTLRLEFDNTGTTLNLSTPAGFSKFAYSGDIRGGTVTIESPFTSGRLIDLTLQGSLTATDGLIIDDVTFTGAGGTGSGTINLDGALYIQNDVNSPINNVNVIATANSSFTSVSNVKLGQNFTLDARGSFSIGVNGITNNGVLEANGGAGTIFDITGGNITNNGTIEVGAGGAFRIRPRASGHFENFTNSTLTGGTYDIGAHSTLTLGRSGTLSVATLQANVALEGTGASFLANSVLSTIGAQGSLTLANGGALSVTSSFTIDGTLDLAASNFTSSKITLAAGGKLGGHGAVLGAVANAGTIDASGGTLLVSQGVTGTGAADIENNATLSFGANVSAGQTVTFEGATGTLALGNAGGFAGTIAGFAPGNAIDLINTKASAVTYNAGADTLTVKNKGTVIATLQLTGDYTGDTFGLASDGKGGTDITVTGPSPAVHRFIEAVAAFSPSHMASIGLSAAHDSNRITPALSTSHSNHG